MWHSTVYDLLFNFTVDFFIRFDDQRAHVALNAREGEVESARQRLVANQERARDTMTERQRAVEQRERDLIGRATQQLRQLDELLKAKQSELLHLEMQVDTRRDELEMMKLNQQIESLQHHHHQQQPSDEVNVDGEVNDTGADVNGQVYSSTVTSSRDGVEITVYDVSQSSAQAATCAFLSNPASASSPSSILVSSSPSKSPPLQHFPSPPTTSSSTSSSSSPSLTAVMSSSSLNRPTPSASASASRSSKTNWKH